MSYNDTFLTSIELSLESLEVFFWGGFVVGPLIYASTDFAAMEIKDEEESHQGQEEAGYQ
jgi:hypothetical protein